MYLLDAEEGKESVELLQYFCFINNNDDDDGGGGGGGGDDDDDDDNNDDNSNDVHFLIFPIRIIFYLTFQSHPIQNRPHLWLQTQPVGRSWRGTDPDHRF